MVKATPQKSPKSLKNKSPKAAKTPLSQAMKEQRTPKAMTPKLVKTPKVKKTPAPVTPEILKKTPDVDVKNKKEKPDIKNGSNDEKKVAGEQISRKRKRSAKKNDSPPAKRVPVESVKTAYVGNLNYDSTKESVTEYFSKFGEVSSCVVPTRRDKKSKGFAFVSFVKEDTLGKILKKKHTIDDRQVVVREKVEKSTWKNVAKGGKPTELLLRNLDVSVDEECIKTYFSKYGKITKITLPTGLSANVANKGFGFVAFSEEDEMKAALEAGKHKLANKEIICAPSLTKTGKKNNSEYDMENQVVVSGIQDDVKFADLKKHFETFGSLRCLNIPKKTRSIAFVTFVNSDSVKAALAGKHKICGKSVTCTPLTKKQDVKSEKKKKEESKIVTKTELNEEEMETDDEEEGDEEEEEGDDDEEEGDDDEEEGDDDEEEGNDDEEEGDDDEEEGDDDEEEGDDSDEDEDDSDDEE